MSTAVPQVNQPDWDRVQRLALLAAAAGVVLFAGLGLVLSLAGDIHGPVQFFLSYLVAYNFWLAIALGCLVILMLQYLTGGVWGLILRRVLESGSRTLAPLALLFLPILVGLFLGDRSLYLWAQPRELEHDRELIQKSAYFSAPSVPGAWYIARSAAYFVVWLALAYYLNRWSREQDRATSAQLPRRFRLLSGPGIILYGATITLASVDWVMSLEPHWYSTIYPVLFAVGQLLAGFAFAVAALVLLATRPPLSEAITPSRLRDIGNLLLAFVILWAYMGFSQYLLIWVGNLPEEVTWPLRRTRAGWQWVAIVLVVFHFALPLLALLFRAIKENPRALAGVALALLVLRFVDVFWWIEPAYSHEGQYAYWLLDVAAGIGLGGVCVWWFVWQLRRYPLLPLHAPDLKEVTDGEGA